MFAAVSIAARMLVKVSLVAPPVPSPANRIPLKPVVETLNSMIASSAPTAVDRAYTFNNKSV